MSDPIITVSVSDTHAIYVNDRRITIRDTKWGATRLLGQFECKLSELFSKLRSYGFSLCITKIDQAEFLKLIKELTADD